MLHFHCIAPPISAIHGPSVVLCSRGYSFESRLQKVVDYALRNGMHHVILLHCPEKKFSPVFVKEVKDRAKDLFVLTNERLAEEGHSPIAFHIVVREGMLHDGLVTLLKENTNILTVFVGMQMLDYRPNELEKIDAPMYFLG